MTTRTVTAELAGAPDASSSGTRPLPALSDAAVRRDLA